VTTRIDGSIQSHNIPDDTVSRDYAIYRCQITRIFYTDDSGNLSQGAQNPQIVYEAVIIGGTNDGRILVNVRDGVRSEGGYYNYEETILRANESPLKIGKANSQPPNQQFGDIVYISFLDGHPRFPIIIGRGCHPLDSTNTGAASTDGPRKRSEHNGVFQEIDKNGNWTLRRKGGALDTQKNVFVPETDGDSATIILEDKKQTRTVDEDAVVEVMDGALQKLTITFRSGMTVTLDGNNDSANIKTAAGAELNLVAGKVALGAGTVELFAKLVLALQKLASAAGSLASSTVPSTGLISAAPGSPVTGAASLDGGTLAAFSTLQSDLTAIKTALDSIKGSL
jgi:hypothetical protein